MKTNLSVLLLLSLSYFSYGQVEDPKNIVMICIDGFRWQELFNGADSSLLFDPKFRKQDIETMKSKYWGASINERRMKLMPFFWNVIATVGQLHGNRLYENKVNIRNRYRFSYPGRSESLCGYYDPQINSNNYENNPNENILEFINKQENYQGQVVAFSSWEALARIINRDRSNIHVNVPGEKMIDSTLSDSQILANELQRYVPQRFGSGIRDDVHTYAIAKSYIVAKHPKVIHLDFCDTDNYGHTAEYDSYLDAAHYLDAMLHSLWNFMQEDLFYKNRTSFVIYTDHGRGTNKNWVNHGFWSPRSNETWLAVMGPDTPAEGELKDKIQIYQDQFAQTIANLLGFTFEANHPVGYFLPTVKGQSMSLK